MRRDDGGLAAQGHLARGHLRPRVGGHDRLGGEVRRGPRAARPAPAAPSTIFMAGSRGADDAGRGGEDRPLLDAEGVRHGAADHRDVVEPRRAGEGVGVAGVRRGWRASPPPGPAGRASCIGRGRRPCSRVKSAGRGGGVIGDDERDVAPRRLQAAGDAAEPEALRDLHPVTLPADRGRVASAHPSAALSACTAWPGGALHQVVDGRYRDDDAGAGVDRDAEVARGSCGPRPSP